MGGEERKGKIDCLSKNRLARASLEELLKLALLSWGWGRSGVSMSRDPHLLQPPGQLPVLLIGDLRVGKF